MELVSTSKRLEQVITSAMIGIAGAIRDQMADSNLYEILIEEEMMVTFQQYL